MNENFFISLFYLQKCLPKCTGKEKTISRINYIVGSEQLRRLQEKHLHRRKEKTGTFERCNLKKKKKFK